LINKTKEKYLYRGLYKNFIEVKVIMWFLRKGQAQKYKIGSSLCAKLKMKISHSLMLCAKKIKKKRIKRKKRNKLCINLIMRRIPSLPYTWGNFLHDFGFTLVSLVTLSLTFAGVIAAVLHDYSLAKSLIEAGGVIWWVGFFMMILGSIKREKEDWLFG